MESMPIDWLSYAMTFIAGSVIGSLLTIWLKPSNQKSRQLEKELDQAEENQAKYKDQVSEHFSETAELFSELTNQYKKVYDHLSKGSQELCNDDVIGNQLKLGEFKEKSAIEKTDLTEENAEDDNFHMPKDYAHSTDKSKQGGTLAEDYGLQKKRDTPID